MDLSEDQARAFNEVAMFLKDPGRQEFVLGGLAGTGKTTLIRHIIEGRSASVCAYTGKAASVLRSKGVDGASTIHKLIYEPFEACVITGLPVEAESRSESKTGEKAETKTEEAKLSCKGCDSDECNFSTKFRLATLTGQKGLVIVDEASMVSRKIYDDLINVAKKIIWVGDHGQLEPIGRSADLMKRCDVKLEKIHRQAGESNVLKLAHHVRMGHRPETMGDDAVVIRQRFAPKDIADYDAVLCGRNRTRVAVNKAIRKKLGHENKPPQKGERLICLQNNSEHGVFNGMLATVVSYNERYNLMTVKDEMGDTIAGLRPVPSQFNREKGPDQHRTEVTYWDFGYAMTTHKAQGSEWDNVCVLEWIARSWSPERWRYTSITRAAKRVTYCIS